MLLYVWSSFFFMLSLRLFVSAFIPLFYTLYFFFSSANAYGMFVLSASCVQLDRSNSISRSLELSSPQFCLPAVCLTRNPMETSWFKNVNWIFACSVTGLTAVAMNVAVPRTNIREDANGNPVLSFYVQFSSSVFLSADTLAAVIRVSMWEYIPSPRAHAYSFVIKLHFYLH